MFPWRYPVQAWRYPLSDLRPKGEPELHVFTGTDVLFGMHVRAMGVEHILAVRCTEDGTMTLLIADDEAVAVAPNFNMSDCEE